MSGKLKEWFSQKRVFNKIDYMSLNRLRQNQSVTSSIPVRLSHAEKTRRADNLIWVRSHDTSLTFDSMTLTHNPYGVTPLTALAIFHSDVPCRLSFTVHCGDSVDFHYDYTHLTTSHVAPIWGMCPNAHNTITITLYRENGAELCTRSFDCQTDALSDDYEYPSFCDENGVTRYIMTMPSPKGKIYPLPNGHFLLVNDKMRTRTGAEPLPTHIHEVDLLGRTYQTCYVGSGIEHVYNACDEENHLLVTIHALEDEQSLFAIIDRETGTVIRTSNELPSEECEPSIYLTRQHLEAVFKDSLEDFVLAGESLEQIDFAETGWLRPPVFYKAASVETTGAVSLDDMKEQYGLTFSIVGNNLSIDTCHDDIQEIVFSHADRLYELDLTNPPLSDPQYEKYHYTLAVPFTEMYSGTYSIVIRFRNGGQAVLQDTVSLSRERK